MVPDLVKVPYKNLHDIRSASSSSTIEVKLTFKVYEANIKGIRGGEDHRNEVDNSYQN